MVEPKLAGPDAEVWMASSLLRDWGLLRERLIPSLLALRRRPIRVWSIGSRADAVALAVAFADADSEQTAAPLQAYTSGEPSDAPPVSFGAADVRSLPTDARTAWFVCQSHRWIPTSTITDRVMLGAPSEPVDLVTMRSNGHPDLRALDHLRAGGHLLLVDSLSTGPSSCAAHLAGAQVAARPRLVRPDRGEERLFHKVGPARPEAGGDYDDRGRPLREDGFLPIYPGEAEDVNVETLADRQRQEELVGAHVDLARSLARRFAHRGQPIEDLEQVAFVALLKAARRFDPDRGVVFAGYATASIVGEVKRYFRDRTWSLRVPRPLKELHLSVKAAREELGQSLGRSPTVAQVAEYVGVSEERILEAMEAGSSYRADALDISGPDGERVVDIPVTDPAFERVLDRERLKDVLPRLDHREQVILKGIYFDGWTQQEVARQLGVSQMQVSRLLARSIAKLQR